MDARVDLLCELAEVTVSQAELMADADSATRYTTLERSRDHAFEAARLAGQTADAQWEVKVLLRISDVLNRCGDHDDAAQMQERALTLMGLSPADLSECGELPADGMRAAAPNQLM